MLNWRKVRRAWGHDIVDIPFWKHYFGHNWSSKWSSIVLLKHGVVSSNIRNQKKKNFVLIFPSSHHAIHNMERTLATIPNGSPRHNASSSVSVMFTKTANRKPLSTKATNMNPTVMKLKEESRFVALHNWSLLFKKLVGMVTTTLFSKALCVFESKEFSPERMPMEE